MERRPKHGRTRVFVALPRPRHAVSAAADAAASHRPLDTPVLAIEGARTHAPAISTGVAAVSPAFFVQVASDRAPGAVAGSAGHHSRSFCRFSMCNVLLTFIMLPFWRAWLTSCRRLAQGIQLFAVLAKGQGCSARIPPTTSLRKVSVIFTKASQSHFFLKENETATTTPTRGGLPQQFLCPRAPSTPCAGPLVKAAKTGTSLVSGLILGR